MILIISIFSFSKFMNYLNGKNNNLKLLIDSSLDQILECPN